MQLFGITVNPLQMIMEFLPSGDLYHLLHSDKPMSYFFQLRIALDIAMGMEYLQSVQPPIIHRDLRSPNVLVRSHFLAFPKVFTIIKCKKDGELR